MMVKRSTAVWFSPPRDSRTLIYEAVTCKIDNVHALAVSLNLTEFSSSYKKMKASSLCLSTGCHKRTIKLLDLGPFTVKETFVFVRVSIE